MEEKYLITFTPANRFFFGSSSSFREGFYVVSLKYPPPTTVLGCLRHTVLMQNGLVKEDSSGRLLPHINDEAIKLTGKTEVKGFDLGDGDFGIIKSLSPVFVVEHTPDGKSVNNILFPAPLDVEMKNGEAKVLGYEKVDGTSFYSGILEDTVYVVKSDRNPKEPPFRYLGCSRFWKDYIQGKSPLFYNSCYEEPNIIRSGSSVGIGREDDRTVKEGMFYYKQDYTLAKGYSFGVVATLSKNDKLRDGVVILGGERSAFRLTVQRVVGKIETVLKEHPVIDSFLDERSGFSKAISDMDGGKKMVVLSPLVCSQDTFKEFEYARVEGINAPRVWSRYNRGEKSEAACMVPACSVLYRRVDGSSRVSSNATLEKIGYNLVLPVNK